MNKPSIALCFALSLVFNACERLENEDTSLSSVDSTKADINKGCNAATCPKWVSQTKTENSTSYLFVGVGTERSVASAQSQALLSAQNAAAADLSVLLATVQQYSILVDTYLEYDAEQKFFLCYARVELNKAFIHPERCTEATCPEWISQAKTENSTSYLFVGVGTASSVAAARSKALLNAQNAAAADLSVSLATVQQYSILVDTYLEYDAEQKTFLFYARVELNKAFITH